MSVRERRVTLRLAALTAAGVLHAAVAPAQTSTPLEQLAAAAAAAQQPQAARLLMAEDGRVLSAATHALLAEGLKSADPAIRAQAVRAAGRFETPSLLNDVMPLLTDRDPGVRRWAAIATANSARLFTQPAIDELLRVMRSAAAADWADYAAALGRITVPTPDEYRRVEAALAAGLPAPVMRAQVVRDRPSAPPAADPVRTEGAARGLESLTRINGKVAPLGDDARSRLTLLVEASGGPSAPALARARRLALQALRNARAVDAAVAKVAARDPDDEVRRLAVVAAGAPVPADGGAAPVFDPAVREAVLRAGLTDPEPRVRYEAVRGWARHRLPADCQPVIRAVSDASTHVALAALDALGEGCGAAAGVTPLLVATADLLAPSGATWHRPAHALVALAQAAPAQAAARLARFAGHDTWQVRVYAARAAGRLANVATLVRLGADAHDNVRTAALGALVALERPEALAVAYDGLTRADYQLVMTSARALAADRDKARATAALMTALLRLTLGGRDTSRDPRVAILETVAVTAAASDRDAIGAFLTDWDPRVAQAAAKAYAAVTGETREAASRTRAPAPPDWAVIEQARHQRLRVTMADGGVMELRLLVDEAPATVARVVALAAKGHYDGLTFHRVEPTFVLQGGSPGANEYMGDGPYMRDEPGVLHARGTVGISTRGRDTGDAQIFVNLVDSPRLDHAYTVFAVVERGMDVADRVLEGDVMARVEVVAAAAP
ncbi:MAG: peptidylprolyl isomerase [Vicinamibacterales bacterium]